MILGGIELGSVRRRPQLAAAGVSRAAHTRLLGGGVRWRLEIVAMPSTISLPHDAATLQQMVRELLATITELRSTVEKQQSHIQYLVRMTFGRRSERLDGPTLFDGQPGPEPEPPPREPPSPTPVVEAKRPGHGRRRRPRDLPRERVEVDLTDAEKTCPCCGEVRVRIGADVSERLDYRPACLFYREIVRPTYVCRNCERQGENIQAAQAPLPPEPLPRGTVAAGLLAHVVVSKWFDHLPLYRLEGILGRLGWDVSRSTLCDQMLACAGVLTPLYERMCQRVRESFAVHTDDTPIPLLHPRRTAHAWVYVGDAPHPYTVFDLTDGRRQEIPGDVPGQLSGLHPRRRLCRLQPALRGRRHPRRLLDARPPLLLRGQGERPGAGSRSAGPHPCGSTRSRPTRRTRT